MSRVAGSFGRTPAPAEELVADARNCLGKALVDLLD